MIHLTVGEIPLRILTRSEIFPAPLSSKLVTPSFDLLSLHFCFVPFRLCPRRLYEPPTPTVVSRSHRLPLPSYPRPEYPIPSRTSHPSFPLLLFLVFRLPSILL
jgi:hypothetical protein